MYVYLRRIGGGRRRTARGSKDTRRKNFRERTSLDAARYSAFFCTYIYTYTHTEYVFTLTESFRISLLFVMIRKNTPILVDFLFKRSVSIKCKHKPSIGSRKRISARRKALPAQHLTCYYDVNSAQNNFNLLKVMLLLSHPNCHEKNITFCINTLLDDGYSLSLIFESIKTRIKK